MATYPRRELLGLSKADRMAIARQVIDSLGGADGNCRADSPAGEHRAHRYGDGDRRGKMARSRAKRRLETTWLRWNAQRAGAFKVWVPPSIGEQVWFLCLGGNTDVAFIGGSLYSDDNPAPGASRNEMVVTAPDGAKFRYDAEAGALQVKGIKSAVVEASVKITLDTPEVDCTNLLTAKNLNVTEGGRCAAISPTPAVHSRNGRWMTTSRRLSARWAGRGARDDRALSRYECRRHRHPDRRGSCVAVG
jgi:phage baseplate assembly protein V